MQIEVFEQQSTPTKKNPSITNWHWHFRNKGKITADAEAFPTKANAIRAAKAVVNAVIKRVSVDGFKPRFTTTKQGDVTVIRWD